MAVKDILAKHSSEVIIHICADVIELTDEGMFDPISNRLEVKANMIVIMARVSHRMRTGQGQGQDKQLF